VVSCTCSGARKRFVSGHDIGQAVEIREIRPITRKKLPTDQTATARVAPSVSVSKPAVRVTGRRETDEAPHRCAL